MRKILMLAVLATAIIPSFAQKDNNRKKIEGSGNVITKNFTVQSFDQLDVSGVFSVQLAQAGTSSPGCTAATATRWASCWCATG